MATDRGNGFPLGVMLGFVAVPAAVGVSMLVWAPLGRPFSPPMLLTALGLLAVGAVPAAGLGTGGVTGPRVAGFALGVTVSMATQIAIAVWLVLRVSEG